MVNVDMSPLSIEDVQKTKLKYPDLEYAVKDSAGQWIGTLALNHVYNDHVVVDSFKIQIDVPKEYPVSFPKVKEIGCRTEKIEKKYKNKISSVLDLHVFPKERYACLGASNELRDKFPPGSSFDQYIENLVVPYFYGLSYFEKNGSWPWGERSHGPMGLIEAYGERRVQSSKVEIINLIKLLRQTKEWKEIGKYLRKIKPRRLCLCGESGKYFHSCHFLGWEGLLKLQSDVNLYKIDIYRC